MDEIVNRLAELAHGLDHTQEAELLVLAQERGLLLRRVRVHERNWWKCDLGIIVAWQTEKQKFVVIDANGCRSLPSVSFDGRRQPMSEADFRALHPDMLALAEPQGRSVRASLEALALVVLLSAQVLVLLVFAGELPPARAALILLLAGLALVLARIAYAVASSRASILWGWRFHQDLWNGVLDDGLTVLQSHTPHDYAQTLRSSLKRRIKGLNGTMALPMELATLLPGLLILGISASELGLYYGLVWASLLLPAIAARHFVGIVENVEEQGLGDNQHRLDLVAQYNIGLRPLGAETFALKRLEAATIRQRGLARRKRALLQTAMACEGLLLIFTCVVSISSAEPTPIKAMVTVAGLMVALGLVGVGRAVAAMAARGRAPKKASESVVVHGMPGTDEALESIELRGVTFQYSDSPRPLFAPTDLIIRRGEIVAVTGPSGAGKSTLLRLALGILQPTVGGLRINGKPVSAGSCKAWRRQIGVVLQDEHVPVGTLKSFLLGMSALPFEAALEILDELGLVKEIDALPMGIQTLIAEGMIPAGLMGRLSIARALLRRPALLVLDEATTDLDEVVQTRLLSYLRSTGIGVLIATHRESAVAIADRCVRVVGSP